MKHSRLPIAIATFALVAASLAAISAPASTPQVASGTFNGCPESGSGGSPQLNRLKNRSVSPDAAQPITVAAMKALPTAPPGAGASRANWPAAVRSAITAQEAKAVVFTGYVVAVSHEAGDPSNCGSKVAANEDVEVYLGESGGASSSHQIIAEITPRWRAAFPAWTSKSLKSISAGGAQVRVTGWLIYDEEALEEGNVAATPWEIEPITRIEITKNGAWADL